MSRSLKSLEQERDQLQRLRLDTFNPVGPNGTDHRKLNAKIGRLSVRIEAARKARK